MKLSFYGHACFSVELNGKHLLFDPFISGNELASSVDKDKIKADYILVSHGHSDHIQDCVAIAKRTGATVIAVYEVAVWLAENGVSHYHPMNTGGKKTFDFGTVKMVNAIHSSQMPDGSYGGNPVGFVICTDNGNFYYSGDTALTMDMALIPDIAKIDFSVLPIGDNFTMDAKDAARAAEMVKTKKVVGVHYDTFGFIKIDKTEARKAFEEKNIELFLPAIGETIDI